jgi:hypothetical protein
MDERRAMTPARKAAIWKAWDGKCWFCRQPVPTDGPEVEYDHVTHLWLAGSDADEDIGPIHTRPCHKIKTAADAKSRAKVKRLWRKHYGPKGDSTLQGQGFDKRLTKKFDGSTVRRKSKKDEK